MTRPGRLAGWLGLGFLGFFVLNQAIVGLWGTRGPTPDWLRALLIAWGIAGLGLGLSASLTALFAILKQGERAVLTWLCLLPGAFAVVLLVGELVGPH